MKNWLIGFVILGTTSTAWNNAQAVGVTLDLGTTGAGGHVVIPLSENKLNVRLGANVFGYSYDGHTSDVNYRFKLKLQTYDALFDYYPTGGAFRLTMGGVINQSRITTQAKSNKLTINGHDYQADDVGSLHGRIDFKRYAPYVGLGWGNASAKGKGWGMTSDIGVVFQGAPRSQLHTDGCKISESACAQFQRDVDAENSKLNDTVKNFKYYPVIRIGVTYQF